jgi:Two-component sensor kinase N-terminal/Histidine kinase-, DNA gyrase B-, and HSP90-like ATPase
MSITSWGSSPRRSIDRSLLDDAYAVAANVRYRDDALDLGLSPAKIGNVLFDQSENVSFAVMLPDGQLLAGHPGLSAPPLADTQQFGFGDTSYQGKSPRSVTLKPSEPARFVVIMAQTTLSRSRLLQRLAAYSLERPVRVTGHGTLLEGILDNLLDNALRYGRAGGGDLSRITVALSRAGAEAVLSVVDNGPGIALAEQQALVQRWAQGPAGVQLGEGAGLGLAIVAQYARAMGVPFSLEVAQPDGGLCASLRFRCEEDPAAPGPGVMAG